MVNYSFTRKNLKDCITNHLILKMKLINVFLISAAVQLSASCYAQKVTLQETNASLQTIFLKVYTQTGYQFFYEDELLEKSSKVSIDVKNVALEYALDKCFEDQPLQYQIVNQTIVISQKVLPGKNITGRVTDDKGEPQIGVAITVKGTFRGTSTDLNGYFSIDDVEDSDILIFSALNLETIEILVGTKLIINVNLKAKSSLLDEVQIIAYQSTTKRLRTGSVSSIKSNQLQIQPGVTPMQALQGRIAGLSINSTSGAVGGNQEIRIRGISTLTAGNQPLIIVDGAIVPNSGLTPLNNNGSYMGVSGTSPFNIINPNDIESIDVLKDADATAIYGSRGTNGVILITTKKAIIGSTKLNIEASTGVNSPAYLPKRLTTSQYLEMRKDAFATGNYNPTTMVAINPIATTAANAPDLLSWDQNFYTDWQNFEFNNPAKTHNIQASLNGGTKYINFYSSFGFLENQDITLGNPYQRRFSGLINLNHKSSNEKFELKLSSNFARDFLQPSRGSVGNFPLSTLPPNMPITTAEGEPFWPTGAISQNTQLTNPYGSLDMKLKSNTISYIGNAEASYQIFKDLKVKMQFGISNQTNNNFNTRPYTSINPFNPGGLVPSRVEGQTKFQTLNFEPQINYSHLAGKSKFDVLLGSTFFERFSENFNLTFEGFSSDFLLDSWAAGNNVPVRNSANLKYRFNSVFGRFGYSFDSKYLVNVTYRRDGSSRFGPENKWGNFGSLGAAWVFSQEKFITEKLPWLSFGKLRGSYGLTGNDDISDFRYTSLFTSSNIIYGDLIGLSPSYISNPAFRWEETKKFDIAAELGFFNNRILLNTTRFRNLSTDLLVDQRIPSHSGFSTFLANFPGIVENKGWEIELTTQNTNPASTFNWRTNFNITILKNTLLEYPDLETSANSTTLEIGKPVGTPRYPSAVQRSWVFTGVDPNTGLPQYEDVNGDGIISTSGNNDKRYIGSPLPRLFGGVNNTLTYKGITLDFFIQFSQQLTTNHLYLTTYPGQLQNPIDDFYGNYWKQPGDISKFPRLFTGFNANTSTALISNIYNQSSAATNDVIYARLKTVSISYSIPSNLISKFSSGMTIFARGQNLFTWVSEPIFKDPETLLSRNSVLRTIVGGINISF